MGKEKDKLQNKKLDDGSLEKVSGGGSNNTEQAYCPKCKTTHKVERLGSHYRVAYKNKWTEGTKYRCDEHGIAFYYYKVEVPGGTVYVDINFDEL